MVGLGDAALDVRTGYVVTPPVRTVPFRNFLATMEKGDSHSRISPPGVNRWPLGVVH